MAGMLLGYAGRRGLVGRSVAVGSCSFGEGLSRRCSCLQQRLAYERNTKFDDRFGLAVGQ